MRPSSVPGPVPLDSSSENNSTVLKQSGLPRLNTWSPLTISVFSSQLTAARSSSRSCFCVPSALLDLVTVVSKQCDKNCNVNLQLWFKEDDNVIW